MCDLTEAIILAGCCLALGIVAGIVVCYKAIVLAEEHYAGTVESFSAFGRAPGF